MRKQYRKRLSGLGRDKLTFKNLQGEMDSGVVLLNFSMPWCAPCSLQDPIIKRIEKRFKQRAKVFSFNPNEMREMAWKFGIYSVPTIVILKQGKEIERFIGLQEERVLAEALERIIGTRKHKPSS